MPRGSLCISIDVELAWGIWDRPSDAYHARCATREAAIVRSLVALFERFSVAATWAIVGRLLERDDAAARSTAYGEGIWYAPELVELVRAARTPQDIGSHSYAAIRIFSAGSVPSPTSNIPRCPPKAVGAISSCCGASSTNSPPKATPSCPP